MRDVNKLTDMSMAVYLADRFGPTLNPSVAHTLVSRSPLHAWMAHPMLGGAQADDTESTEDGSIVHDILFEQGLHVVYVDADSWRTKAAREEAEAVRSMGCMPVLQHKAARYGHAVSAIRRAIEAFGLQLDGETEVTFVWSEETRSGKAHARCRMDHLHEGRPQIIELKTIRSADLRSCQRAIHEHGYDIQMAAQCRAFEKWRPDLAGRLDFVWVFAEIEPPYAVTPLRPCGALRAMGDKRWERAVERWAFCRKFDKWPAYVDAIETVQPVPWSLSEELAEV